MAAAHDQIEADRVQAIQALRSRDRHARGRAGQPGRRRSRWTPARSSAASSTVSSKSWRPSRRLRRQPHEHSAPGQRPGRRGPGGHGDIRVRRGRRQACAALAGSRSRQARDRLTETVTDADVAATVGDELFAVVRLLDEEPGLRRALADYTRPREARTGLVGRTARRTGVRGHPRRGLRAGRRALVGAQGPGRRGRGTCGPRHGRRRRAARATWTTSRTNCSGSAGSSAASPSCSRPWPTSGAARRPQARAARRAAHGQGRPAALRLITQAVINPRGRNLEANLADYARLVAAWRQRLIAVVRVATELSGRQRERLTGRSRPSTAKTFS